MDCIGLKSHILDRSVKQLMAGNLSKYNQNPSRIKEFENSSIDEFKLHMVTEAHHSVMIVLFFIAAFAIYFLIKITLITLIDASQFLMVFGLVGFGLLFLVRKRFGLSILDGLYYCAFAVAPISMALFLWINTLSQQDHTETHKVVGVTPGGRGYVYELENDAYTEYWRIRNMSEPPSDLTNTTITYTFSEGVFGYRVIRESVLE